MRIAVALSGGVDSTAVARQLLDEGHEVVGLTMRLCPDPPGLLSATGSQARARTDPPEDGCSRCAVSCACLDGVASAKQLGVEHHLLDLRKAFEERVIGPFVAGFAQGLTPNPCALCNRDIKFGLLLDQALALGAEAMATGHYACVEHGPGKPRILRAADAAKDQTYFLSLVPADRFRRVRFPLCGRRKRELLAQAAQTAGAPATSQEICFLRGHAYADFVRQRAPEAFRPGTITDLAGRVLGEHQGLPNYTIGQRRGLGVAAPHPLYVVRLDREQNRVVVGPDEALWSREVRVGNVNGSEQLDGSETVEVMIRYRQRPAPARVRPLDGRACQVTFDQPVRAVTPGQVAAFYRQGALLAGGEIQEGGERA